MSERLAVLGKTLDLLIIISGYIIAIVNIFSAQGEQALLAFIWSQVALFWYFAIYRRKKSEQAKTEIKSLKTTAIESSKTETSPIEPKPNDLPKNESLETIESTKTESQDIAESSSKDQEENK